MEKLALVQLNGNRIKIKWLSKYAKRLITVCFQTVYGLIFLKNPIELNQCPKITESGVQNHTMKIVERKKTMGKDDIVLSLCRFKEMNRTKYEIVRIGIFGSAARDDMKEKSDIDVVVELERQDLFYLIGIKQDIEEQFSKPVDIISYRKKMNPFLKKRVDKEAVYV